MKLYTMSLVLWAVSISTHAQQNGTLLKSQLSKVYIDEEISLHFLSPEPIQYVDISTDNMIGDIPLENVFRLKAIRDSVSEVQFAIQPQAVNPMITVAHAALRQ